MRLPSALMAVALAGLALWTLGRARKSLAVWRRLRRPLTGGFDRLEGPVVVTGRVLADETVESPLDGRRGVYVRCLVEERREGTALGLVRNVGSWHAVAFAEEATPFWLCGEDGSRLLVDPSHAMLLGTAATKGTLAGGLRRYEQTVVEEGAAITVVAEAVPTAGPTGERLYRHEAVRSTLTAPGAGPHGEPEPSDRIETRLVMGPAATLRRAVRHGTLGWTGAALVLGLLSTVAATHGVSLPGRCRPAREPSRLLGLSGAPSRAGLRKATGRRWELWGPRTSTLESAYSTR